MHLFFFLAKLLLLHIYAIYKLCYYKWWHMSWIQLWCEFFLRINFDKWNWWLSKCKYALGSWFMWPSFSVGVMTIHNFTSSLKTRSQYFTLCWVFLSVMASNPWVSSEISWPTQPDSYVGQRHVCWLGPLRTLQVTCWWAQGKRTWIFPCHCSFSSTHLRK